MAVWSFKFQQSVFTMITYVLVADSSIAKLFSIKKSSGELTLVDSLTSPDARLRNQELKSDKAGRVFDIKGAGRHDTEGNQSPKQQAAVRFSKVLADRLKKDLLAKRFGQLYFVAEPGFLGLLRQAIDDDVADLLKESVSKNLTRHDLEDIRNSLPKYL